MKKLIVFSLLVLLAAGTGVYLNPDWRAYFQRQGDAVMDKARTTTVYKWKDPQGRWQVSNQKPPPGTDYQRLEYQRDTNVMPRETLTGRSE